MAQFLAPLINTQQFDANGDPLSGGLIEVYLAGSSTPATTTSDKAGVVPNSWPIVLNTLGLNTQGAVWITGGAAYKYVIKNAAGVTLRTIDNISGINDTTVAIDQWIPYQGTPTYVSATSFTIAGDQTQVFQVARRLKTQNTGGLVYSTIVSSSYSAPNTTITVANDSGVLDAGLSQVSYGVISAVDTSAPLQTRLQKFTVSGSFTVPAGVTKLYLTGTGGGGGGAGTATVGDPNLVSGAGGGGAGNITLREMFSVSPGQVYAVTVGAAGTGGALNSAGGAGGATSFGGLLSLGGGSGGAPGNAAVYTAYTSGGAAGAGFSAGISGQDTGPVGVAASGGAGGNGPFGSSGAGGKGVITGAAAEAGVAATGYGTGGGGAGGNYAAGNTVMAATTGAVGGDGTPGLLIVEW